MVDPPAGIPVPTAHRSEWWLGLSRVLQPLAVLWGLDLRADKSNSEGAVDCTDRETNAWCGDHSPLVQARKFVLALLVPLAPSLEVVLVVQATTNRAAPGEPLRDVLPLHATAS